MSASLDTVMQLLAQITGGQDHVEIEESAKGKTQVRVIHYGPDAEQTAVAAYDRLRERYGTPLELTIDEMIELLVAADAHLANMGGTWSTQVPSARIGAIKRATAKLQAAMGPDATLEAQRRALPPPEPEPDDEPVAAGAGPSDKSQPAADEPAPGAPPPGMGRSSNGELFELEPTPLDDVLAPEPVQ